MDSSLYMELCLSNMLSGMENDLSNDNLSIAKKNYYLLEKITNFVAELNIEYFNEKLNDRLNENKNYLHIIPLSEKALVDEWGRCTYFYCKIGLYILLIYQPGTPTFLSSIKKDSDLVTIHDNCQQNGAILGMGCALFLADFITYLCRLYQENCSNFKLDSSNFHPNIYKISLEICLKKFVDEDRDAHGRLIEMKDLLLNLGGKDEIKCESLKTYFYSKDIFNNFQNFQIDYSQISSNDFIQILNKRKQSSTYQNLENYFQLNIFNNQEHSNFLNSQIWKIIRENILNKNGIFKDLQLTRRWLKITFDVFEKEYIINNSTNDSTNDNNNNNQLFEENYDLLKNEKLMEYYTQIQRGLQSLFLSSIIADADIFSIRTSDLRKSIEYIGELIPETKNIIFSISQIIQQTIGQKILEKKLNDLCNLSVRYPILPELLARKITIIKRYFIMNLKDNQLINLSSKFENIIKTNNSTKYLTIQQKLAIHDVKILETCTIRLLCNNNINPLTDNLHFIIENIINDFKKIQSYSQISPQLTSINEQPIYFKRQQLFSIPNYFFDQHQNHKFMKSMANDEDSNEHRQRVKQYLLELNKDKIQDLLGSIDPSEYQLNPLFSLLIEVKREKENNCIIL